MKKLHILIVAMLLATTASFADVMTSSTITTNTHSYDEVFDSTVTLTNVLVMYHPDVGNNEFRLELTTDTGIKTIDMIPTGVFDINPNIITDAINVKLLRRAGGSSEAWVPTTQFNYEWNIPEPATMSLFLTAGVGLLVIRRIKRY